MNMYAAGKNLGQGPSEFLLFQHYVIGLGLKFLYVDCPGFPWYGALLYLYLFVSSLVIGYVFSRLCNHFSVIGLWLVLFFLFYLQVIVSPQFTLCAGYLAIAGILLLYAAIYRPNASRNVRQGLLFLGIGFLIWAGLVRFYSLLLVLLSMAPLYGYLLVTRFTETWRRLLPLLFCVALAGFFLNWTQIAYYEHSPGWERFYSYNNVRAEFIDRHKITWDKNTEPFFRRIGWSRNDLAMLTSWFYIDAKVYSFNNLLFISRHTSVLPRPSVAWDKLLAGLEQSLLSYCGIGALLLGMLVAARKPLVERGCVLVAVLWYGLLFSGISIVERHLPVRVWLVMLCSLYVTELVLWCAPAEVGAQGGAARKQFLGLRIVTWFIAGGYLLCSVANIRVIKKLSDKYGFYQTIFREDLAKLKPRPDQLFVTWGGDFPYQTFQLPKESEPASANMQFLGLGVGNHEPVVQNRLRAFGIEDLYRAFYERDDVFVICVKVKRKLLAQYIWEHYHTRVLVETFFEGRTFTVCRVVKAS